MSAVAAAMKLMTVDRPTWSVDDRLVSLWEEEFANVSGPTLAAAARRFLRSTAGKPTIKAFHDAIEAVRREQQEAVPLLEAGEAVIETSPEAMARIKQKYPWYSADATMEELLVACRNYNRTIPFEAGAFAAPF